jgi:hypothetical protein
MKAYGELFLDTVPYPAEQLQDYIDLKGWIENKIDLNFR